MPKTKKGNACGAGSFPGSTADGGMLGKLAEGGGMRNSFGDERKRDEFMGIFTSYRKPYDDTTKMKLTNMK